jgi:hypothetical protein
MKKIEITLYKFSELSEEAKENAVGKLRDINVHEDWHECIYEDAKEIGCKITGFDLDRGRHCSIELYDDIEAIANKILSTHGETCDTYKEAEHYLQERNSLIGTAPKDENGDFEDEYALNKELDYIYKEFKKELESYYASILQNAYEYLWSDEAVIEAIEANDYDFTADGDIY